MQARALALFGQAEAVAGAGRKAVAGAAAAEAVAVAPLRPALASLQRWLAAEGHAPVADLCSRFAEQSRSGASLELQGPTGERNVYRLSAREEVLCLAAAESDLLCQLAAVLAVGAPCTGDAQRPDGSRSTLLAMTSRWGLGLCNRPRSKPAE